MTSLRLFYLNRRGAWETAGTVDSVRGCNCRNDHVQIQMTCTPQESGIVAYTLDFSAAYPTRLKLEAATDGAHPWHLIPCCIHGDNNLSGAKPGQYPNLTDQCVGERFSSPYWEFRADRASHPVSMLFSDAGAIGLSIQPYGHDPNGRTYRNGVFAALPDRCGVTLGYANLPVTFLNKYVGDNSHETRPTCDLLCQGHAEGLIFDFPDRGREAVRDILARLYRQHHERPVFRQTVREACQALLDSFIHVNWSDEFQHYTNQECHLPDQPNLKPWRPLLEIAWTGGAILAYPFLTAEHVLNLSDEFFAGRKSGRALFDEIAASYNPASGLLFDLVRNWQGSRVNGWWKAVGLTVDVHCSYTNGEAVYYLLRAVRQLQDRGECPPPAWQDTALKVLDTLVKLQRSDGCCGFTFATDRPAVVDWEGMAGCWIAAALAMGSAVTGRDDYRQAADRAVRYYERFVRELNCWGTPMDTWKAPDQEGNLAFMKAVRLLHQQTGNAEYLSMLEASAHYEYLWRYGFKAIPECPPLAGSDWNSCGGSVTSVSNPHIHPMGLLATEDLYYLADVTGNPYHCDRADDAVAWAMNSLELYPDVTGYGQYGITTERYCPSDGFTLQTYCDGRPASMWFSYNGWAAANMLEGLLWVVEHSGGKY